MAPFEQDETEQGEVPERLQVFPEESIDLVPPPGLEARAPIQPTEPSAAERASHMLTHCPVAPWCEVCIAGRGVSDPHAAKSDLRERIASS